MITEQAFKLSPVSPSQTVEIDKTIEAYRLLKEFDNFLQDKLGLQLSFINIDQGADEFSLYEKCQKLIKDEGITSIMSVIELREALIPKMETKHFYLIVEMLRHKLEAMSPKKEIILVDSYIFPKHLPNKDEYLQIFHDIFEGVARKMASFRFVTKPNYNVSLYKDIQKRLLILNSEISIQISTTNTIHDRFWIVDRSRGLFIGTSLNGIGKKYALVDNIREEDTQDIVKLLDSLSLI